MTVYLLLIGVKAKKNQLRINTVHYIDLAGMHIETKLQLIPK